MNIRGTGRTSPVEASLLEGSLLLLIVFLVLPACSSAQGVATGPTSPRIVPDCTICDSILSSSTTEARGAFPAGPGDTSQPLMSPAAQVPSSLVQSTEEEQAQPPNQNRKEYSPSATNGSPGHIFWVIPAYKVDYGSGFKPLTDREKFQEWAQSSYDPLGFGVSLFEAGTLEYSSTDGFCGYGHGWAGYGKCFGSLELDADVSSFIGDYLLTVAFHQDPRFFRLGKGSFGRRVWYTVSRVFVTYNDSGHTVFYSSGLAGTAIASGLSNLYYPQQDRGWSPSLSRAGIDLGNTAIYNAAAEFWPDIHQGLHHIF